MFEFVTVDCALRAHGFGSTIAFAEDYGTTSVSYTYSEALDTIAVGSWIVYCGRGTTLGESTGASSIGDAYVTLVVEVVGLAWVARVLEEPPLIPRD